MKRQSCIELLKLLKKFKVELPLECNFTIEDLFDISDELTLEILKAKEKFQLLGIFELLSKYPESKETFTLCGFILNTKYEFQVKNMLKAVNKLDEKSLSIAEIISKCENEFCSNEMLSILSCDDIVKENLELDSIKIMVNCKNDTQTRCVSDVLKDKKCIDAKISLEGAMLLTGCAVEDVLWDLNGIITSGFLIKRNTAIEVAQIAQPSAKNADVIVNVCNYYAKLIRDNNLSRTKLDSIDEIEMAKIVAASKEDFQRETLEKIFTNHKEYYKDIYEAIKFINVAKKQSEASEMYSIILFGYRANEFPSILTKFENITGYTNYNCDNIQQLRINEALLLLDGSIEDDLPEDINVEEIKRLIKKNENNKYFIQGKN